MGKLGFDCVLVPQSAFVQQGGRAGAESMRGVLILFKPHAPQSLIQRVLADWFVSRDG